MQYHEHWVDETRHQQNPDRNGLTKPGSERIDKSRVGLTKPGSERIDKSRIGSIGLTKQFELQSELII